MSDAAVTGLRQLVLDAGEISGRERRPLHPGVTYTILWREGRSAAGVMWIAPDHEVPEHTHEEASHHIWLSEGHAEVEGRTLGPGSYWHVPPGVPHVVRGSRPRGCTLFYLYLAV